MLGVLATGLSSCLAEPKFSTTPEISFNNINLTHISSPTLTGDSVTVTINYQDGDGDLGLTASESAAAPYVGTRYAQNYFVEAFIKDKASGQFVSLASLNRQKTTTAPILYYTASEYYSRFEPITSEDNHAPIKGVLNWKFVFPRQAPFFSGEEVRFQVSIADRALHESNTITTASVIFP